MRSWVWIPYAIVAFFVWIAVIAGIGEVGFFGILAALLITAYAVYLYNGGGCLIIPIGCGLALIIGLAAVTALSLASISLLA